MLIIQTSLSQLELSWPATQWEMLEDSESSPGSPAANGNDVLKNRAARSSQDGVRLPMVFPQMKE